MPTNFNLIPTSTLKIRGNTLILFLEKETGTRLRMELWIGFLIMEFIWVIRKKLWRIFMIPLRNK
jgi:hypothetical protein